MLIVPLQLVHMFFKENACICTSRYVLFYSKTSCSSTRFFNTLLIIIQVGQWQCIHEM